MPSPSAHWIPDLAAPASDMSAEALEAVRRDICGACGLWDLPAPPCAECPLYQVLLELREKAGADA